MKNWITLGLSAALLASCSPWPEPGMPHPGDPRGPVPAPPAPMGPGPSSPTPRPDPTPPKPKPKPTPPSTPKPKPKYPTATSIPGKDGHVFNPYTNDPVDVRGIPSGSLVTDPNDEESRKFRVP